MTCKAWQDGEQVRIIESSAWHFVLQQSSVIIHGSAQIVLTNVLVRLAGNNFTARKGIITVKRGISVALVEVAILANAFEGVRLDLGNLDPGKVQIRNNDAASPPL